MLKLDSEEEIRKLDKGGILDSIRALPDQVKQVVEDFRNLEISPACNLSKNIVIAGMGGSALGGRIIDSLIYDRIRVPIEVFTEIKLPNYVNKDTLLIVSSYSGNTEETILTFYDGIKRGAKVFVITTGGKLSELIERENIDGYVYTPKFNLSNQPRMGLGYSISSILSLLVRCGYTYFDSADWEEIVQTLETFNKNFGVETHEVKNLAKKVAKDFRGRIPVVISSEHLLGSSHAFRNQLNENSKTLSLIFDIPELNHHLMEGLTNPEDAKKFLYFLFLESELYSSDVSKRYSLTKEVVEKNNVRTGVYKVFSDTKIEQVFEILVLGSYVSFYLSMLYGTDPSPIPWVDYFKKELSRLK